MDTYSFFSKHMFADYGVLAFGLSGILLNFPNDVEGKMMSNEGKKVWMEYVQRKTSTTNGEKKMMSEL